MLIWPHDHYPLIRHIHFPPYLLRGVRLYGPWTWGDDLGSIAVSRIDDIHSPLSTCGIALVSYVSYMTFPTLGFFWWSIWRKFHTGSVLTSLIMSLCNIRITFLTSLASTRHHCGELLCGMWPAMIRHINDHQTNFLNSHCFIYFRRPARFQIKLQALQ